MADLGTSERTDLDRLLRAIAFSERRELLRVLREDHIAGGGGLTITELSLAVEASRFTCSRNLQILREAGLARVSVRGPRRVHTLDVTGLAAIEDWLIPFTDCAPPSLAVAASHGR